MDPSAIFPRSASSPESRHALRAPSQGLTDVAVRRPKVRSPTVSDYRLIMLYRTPRMSADGPRATKSQSTQSYFTS